MSFPFDWVATSPAILVHCLSDRFETFLNQELAVSRGIRAGHKVYNANFFGHRNPRSIQADFDYYLRTVQRFLQLMDRQEPVIFITTVLNEAAKRPVWADGFVHDFHRPENQSPQDFIPMMDAINTINPNARFVFIEEYTEVMFSLEITVSNERMLWIRHCAMGRSTGVQYLDEVDDQVALRLYSALKG